MIYATVSVRDSDLGVVKEITKRNFEQYIRTVRDLLEWMVNPDPDRQPDYSASEWSEASSIKQDVCSGDLRVSRLEISGEEYAVNLGDAIPFPPLSRDTVHLKLDYRI